MRIIGGEHIAPLLLLFKGQSLTEDEVSQIVQALRVDGVANDMLDWQPVYTALDPVEARAAIVSWKTDAAE